LDSEISSTKAWLLAGSAAAALAFGPGTPAATAGAWSAAATLGQAGITVVGDVAVDTDGRAVVVWADDGGAVRAAVRSPDTAFEPTRTLAPDGGRAAAVALDGDGGALVAWSRNGSLGLAERRGDQPELMAVPTAVNGVQDGPDVAFAGTGRAVVAWVGADGAVHALVRELGRESRTIADLEPGPGNTDVHLDAAGGHLAAVWAVTERVGSQVTTRVRASLPAPGGSFTTQETIASATGDVSAFNGSVLGAWKVAVSAGGSADVLIDELRFQGIPGETALAGLVAARPAGAWVPAQQVGFADGLPYGGQYDADIAAAGGGDALYVGGAKQNLVPTMTFSARSRPAGAASYGEAYVLDVGQPGQVRVAPLTGSRFLVLQRSGTELRSRAGNMAAGFENPLVFSGTDGSQILGLAGAPSGLAAAAWLTTSGQLHAAIYDDSLEPRSPPPPAAADTVRPVLSRLSVSPRRFGAPRPARGARARGTRIRWSLSEAARVTFRVDRTRPGARRRVIRKGSFARTAPKGRATLRFTGFLRGRALRPGRYVLTAIARDAAGNRSRAKRTTFTVVRRH
jgi:hypothetical protein